MFFRKPEIVQQLKFVVLVLLSTLISKTYAVEFDSSVLASLGFTDVDLSAFSGSQDQFSGEYIVTININERPVLYHQSVYFYTEEEQSHLCFTHELLDDLPIKKEFTKALQRKKGHLTEAGECFSVASLDESINTHFDGEQQRLELSIPHLYLEDFDDRWVAPRQRDHGISGIVLDYSLLTTSNRLKKVGSGYQTTSSLRSYGVLGANIGRFRFRADYQYSSKKYGSGDKLEWTQTYAFTDIAAINSKLYVGELFSRSHIFDSVRFKGVSLFSDENMMPSFLQGYSPQITGTAVTNAIVTVTQYGQVLRTVQVPAGPFAISDIPTYVSGTVDVEIENDNGEHQIYQVDISHVPYLTRKGQFRYNANAGKLSPLVDDINIKTHFISVDGSFGLTNNTSLLGGVVTTTDNRYRAMSMGLGLNLEKFGAISFDVTQSESKNRNNESLKGNNYRINYAKRFGQTTTFNLSAYRSGNRSYQTLNGYINAQKSENLMGYLDKERFSISLSQTIPSLNANIYATVSKSSRWGGGNNTNYNISASRTIQEGMFQNTSVQLSVMKSRYDSGRSDHQVSFFLTIPLETENYARVQYSANYNKSKYMDHQATYYQDLWGGMLQSGLALIIKEISAVVSIIV